MEALSPPRVTPHSPASGVVDAGAWDLTSGWDATEDAQYGDAAEARRDDDDAQSMTVPQHARREDNDAQSMTVPQHAPLGYSAESRREDGYTAENRRTWPISPHQPVSSPRGTNPDVGGRSYIVTRLKPAAELDMEMENLEEEMLEAPDVDQPPLKSISMDVKELPGWQPHQRVKALNIVCDTSSFQSMTPIETDDTEGAMDLLRLYRDNWTRLFMRPRWLKVDPARTFISDQFKQAMNRDGTKILKSAGMAHEQNDKVEKHGQWFEILLQRILTEVQPTTESEWRECVAQLQEAKNSLLDVGGTSPCQIVFGINPEAPEDLVSANSEVFASSAFFMILSRLSRPKSGR